MKAVVYQKPYELSLEDIPEPKIEDPTDIILRVTSTAICGSDLHSYHGLIPHMRAGTVLGHEFLGIVEEVGPEVRKWHQGDRVVVPFPIACGECEMCQRKLWTHCKRSNPSGEQGALFGHGDAYGGVPGGQAEYVRVPYADVGPIGIPDDLRDEQVLFLTDILPTAYWIVDVCGVKPGSTVAVFGCGPVGLLAQRCAFFKGAERVIAVDHAAYRLEFAKQINPQVKTIDFSDITQPGEAIQEMTGGEGADVAIDAAGLEAEPTKPLVSAMTFLRSKGMPDPPGLRPKDQPAVVSTSAINWAVEALRHGGTLGLAGVYGGQANDFPIGDLFAKGITLYMGQCPVQTYLAELLDYIQDGKLRADDIITHVLPLEDALLGYELFSRKEDNCVKVIMHPTPRE